MQRRKPVTMTDELTTIYQRIEEILDFYRTCDDLPVSIKDSDRLKELRAKAAAIVAKQQESK